MKSNNIHIINYGSTKINFELKYVERKTLGITVNPDTSVIVKAPIKAEVEKILNKVEKRAKWIIKQKNYFESFLPVTPPREYVSGETHRYLGKQYLLKVLKEKPVRVRMLRGYFFVYITNNAGGNRIKGLLGEWYMKHAEKRFKQSLQQAIGLFKPYKISYTSLVIKRMNKRWGSCTPKGKIILNPEIIKAPPICIDYVIIHELCHLIHPHHDKEFYNLLNKIMPDWKKWKDRLEKAMV